MKYFIIAGEASGDLHASVLIKALKEKDNKAEFRFLGGDEMAKYAECPPVVHYRNMAYMGFIDVIKHLKEILGIMKLAENQLLKFKPDALILVDYPSFNLKVAKFAKKHSIPVYYYISPKVWAWKEYRVKKIKKYVDHMFSILPFETAFYRKHNYEIEYVGNPSVKEIDEVLLNLPDKETFCKKHSLDAEKQIVALLPGSRKSEIEKNLPEMVKAMRRFPDIQVVIAGAPAIDENMYGKVIKDEGSYTVPHIVTGETYALLKNADAALVTSGTATLETALIGTPQIACYRMNGSKLVYKIFSHILKVNYVTLPNLVVDEEIIPELLLHNCHAENIAFHLKPLLISSPKRDQMLDNYKRMREILGTDDCAEVAASEIIKSTKTKHE